MEDNKKIKIQIKSIFGKVIFEYEKENNTIKETVEEAVRQNVNLSDSDLSGSNLSGSNLSDSNLSGAKNIPFIPYACPSDGAFIGWKKVPGFLVKLEIPEDARRCSATSTKCRCDKAKVLEITYIDTNEQVAEVTNYSYKELTYKVGEMVYPDKFDEDRWIECSHGIHFFIDKQEAINY